MGMCDRKDVRMSPAKEAKGRSRERRFISVTKHSPHPPLSPTAADVPRERAVKLPTAWQPARGVLAVGIAARHLRLCRSGQSLAGSHPGSTAAAGGAARPSCGQLRAAGTRHPLLSQERLPGARLPAPEVGAACSAPKVGALRASCRGAHASCPLPAAAGGQRGAAPGGAERLCL